MRALFFLLQFLCSLILDFDSQNETALAHFVSDLKFKSLLKLLLKLLFQALWSYFISNFFEVKSFKSKVAVYDELTLNGIPSRVGSGGKTITAKGTLLILQERSQTERIANRSKDLKPSPLKNAALIEMILDQIRGRIDKQKGAFLCRLAMLNWRGPSVLDESHSFC